jgi:hypothetical protein
MAQGIGIDMPNDSGILTEQAYLSTEAAFTEWLYENYSIGNGHTLTRLQEDGDVAVRYLKDMGLPLDTEFI